MMRVFIVEDETAAYENLIGILQEIDPEIEILGQAESIQQTVRWLSGEHQQPDLIFMDIHLSDGSAFSIFSLIEVNTPIVFTTAYDQYALDAFQVNSIDYLLKPLNKANVEKALNKFQQLTQGERQNYLALQKELQPSSNGYKTRMLLAYRDKLIPVQMDEIAFIYSTNKQTTIYLKDGKSYAHSGNLEQLMGTLNPGEFFRANKQFIVARSAVKELTVWFDSRLLVKLCLETPEPLYVSKNKALEFKSWMTN